MKTAVFVLALVFGASQGLLAAGDVAPASGAAAMPRRAAPPEVSALFRNPDAWVLPASYIALVNHDGAVDTVWLEELAGTLQRELRMQVKVVASKIEKPADAYQLAASVRRELATDAKVFVTLTKLAMEPVLASPQAGWSVMNVDWVTAVAADEAKVKERMAKQVYRALGFALGAGLRMEPQAVMHPAIAAQDLDAALSHNYHPQNLSVVMTMAKALGVEAIRMKPRAELEKMGLLKPKPTPAAPASGTPAPVAP